VILDVLGSGGAWPTAGGACSGYLLEHDGFRLLLDIGYAVVPRLLERLSVHEVDAVFVTHGHPDHCADLNPLLRARALDSPSPPLPVYAPPGALDAVLALDRPGMLDDAYVLHEFSPGASLEIGPFRASTRLLPHWVPNAGVRLTAGGEVLAYTGDSGPSPAIVDLARDADLSPWWAQPQTESQVAPADRGRHALARDHHPLAGRPGAGPARVRRSGAHRPLRPTTSRSTAWRTSSPTNPRWSPVSPVTAPVSGKRPRRLVMSAVGVGRHSAG
jgi:ribonuclease BN (tRNA processing enzyme)